LYVVIGNTDQKSKFAMPMAVQKPTAAAAPIQPENVDLSDTQLDRESNTNRAYREIRRRIMQGDMPPGDQYLEQELAEMLGMSRTPVREALIRLADERLVEVKPRHGARVLPVSLDDIREIYELLAELESLAARRLATNGASHDVIAALEKAQAQMAAAVQSGDRTLWAAGDCAFHACLVSTCGNDRLFNVVKVLKDQCYRARQRALDMYSAGERSDREHREIIDAIKRRDPDAAARWVRQHRTTGGAAILGLLASVDG
jgi:DNA-binding GntR family transcriptional regulator